MIRRLTMITGNQPILTVKPITEGIIGGTADAAMGRVMDGMC